MKAILIEEHGGPEVLVLKDVETPTPGPGEVLLRTLQTSVNFADVKMRRSLYRGRKPPFVPGFDGVGEVVALGEGVSHLSLGQRVAAYMAGGSYAEYSRAKATLCYPLPEQVSHEDGTGIGIMITAYNALTRAGRLAPGQTVLVHAGAGGVGSSAIQLARTLGAGKILTTVGHPDKSEAARNLGADVVIHYLQEDFASRVMEETNGKGADLILDTVGGKVFEAGLTCLATFGNLVIFGHSSGEPGHFQSKPLHRENRAVIGYSSGGIRRHNPELLQPTAQAVLDLMAQDKVHTLVGGRFPLAQASEAHALVESRRSIGKVLLTP